jgi:hypothetical protein
MHSLFSPWKVAGLFALFLQGILTLNHIKFFPFSDHGIFEVYRKIDGQAFYRFTTKETHPHYKEEGILYENTIRLQELIKEGVPLNELSQRMHYDIIAIDKYQLPSSKRQIKATTSNEPLFTKERIFEK